MEGSSSVYSTEALAASACYCPKVERLCILCSSALSSVVSIQGDQRRPSFDYSYSVVVEQFNAHYSKNSAAFGSSLFSERLVFMKLASKWHSPQRNALLAVILNEVLQSHVVHQMVSCASLFY